MSTEQHIGPSSIVTKAGVGVDGPGYLAGEHPAGRTTINGTPVSADVDVFYELETKDWQHVASTTSQPDGTWSVVGLDPDKRFNVVARHASFGGVIAVDVQPSRTDVVTLSGAFTANDDFNGVAGFMAIESGMPPFTASVIDPLPYGLMPLVVDGRKLIIDGTSDDVGLWESVVRVTASNGVWVDVPVQVQIQMLTDPHWDKVVALLRFDGGYTDETGRAWSAGAPSSIDSVNPIFGTGSLYQNGTGDGVYTPNPIGDPSSRFTIEGFCRLDALPPAFADAPAYRRSTLYSNCTNTTNGDCGLSIEHTPLPARVNLDLRGGAAGLYYYSEKEFTIPFGEVFHFAHTFDGAYHRVFINGSLYISVARSVGLPNASEPFRVGQSLVPIYYGYRSGSIGAFDEFRITKGVARYTENFTPPVNPFPSR